MASNFDVYKFWNTIRAWNTGWPKQRLTLTRNEGEIMTVEELIIKLSKFPPHFTVQIFQEGDGLAPEFDLPIDKVSMFGNEKIVNIETLYLIQPQKGEK
jgi:hypothetical protein